jgi:type I restriction enzyme R subunit
VKNFILIHRDTNKIIAQNHQFIGVNHAFELFQTRQTLAGKLGVTEDELEIFDLLCKDTMTQAETQKVKLAAKALLHRLNDETPKMLVQDWYKTDQTRLIVRSAVAEVLDRELPQDGYDRVLFQAKCDNVFHLVPDHAVQERKWAA